MSNGAIYSETHNVVEIHEEKLKALFDIIEAANGKPVLVFYNFKHDFDRIVKFLKTKKLNAVGLKDSEDIKKWNNGEIPILLVHPASAGHGLNLQYGGNIIVWLALSPLSNPVLVPIGNISLVTLIVVMPSCVT